MRYFLAFLSIVSLAGCFGSPRAPRTRADVERDYGRPTSTLTNKDGTETDTYVTKTSGPSGLWGGTTTHAVTYKGDLVVEEK